MSSLQPSLKVSYASPTRTSSLLHKSDEEDLLPHLKHTAKLVNASLVEVAEPDFTAPPPEEPEAKPDVPSNEFLLFNACFPESSTAGDCGHLRRDPRLQHVHFTVPGITPQATGFGTTQAQPA